MASELTTSSKQNVEGAPQGLCVSGLVLSSFRAGCCVGMQIGAPDQSLRNVVLRNQFEVVKRKRNASTGKVAVQLGFVQLCLVATAGDLQMSCQP